MTPCNTCRHTGRTLHETNCCCKRLCSSCLARHDKYGCNTRALTFVIQAMGSAWRCVNCHALMAPWKTMCGHCLQPRTRRDKAA